MKLSPEEAWAGTLESMVDNRVVFYLKRYNRDYQDYSRQMKELCEKYPAIIQLIDGNNGVTLMMRNTRYLKPTASCHLTGKCWNGHTIITLDKQICSITKSY